MVVSALAAEHAWHRSLFRQAQIVAMRGLDITQ
jgi:hypothetical protein